MAPPNVSSTSTLSRRTLLTIISIILAVPLIRFVTHRIPKKPVIIKVTDPLKQDRYLVKDNFILFSKNDQVWAVSRSCTHLGCRLNYKETEDLLECPCHQSRFTTQGGILNGPAKRELQRFSVEKNEDPPYFLVST